MALSKKDILALDDTKPVEVEIKAWGSTVFVKPLSGKARDKIDELVAKCKGGDYSGLRTLWVSMCLCDEGGELLFSKADLGVLGEKNNDALEQVWQACQKLSGMSDDAVEDAAEN